MVTWQTLKGTNQALEREHPPWLNWTKKDKIVIDVKGHMMVWVKRRQGVDRFKISNIVCDTGTIRWGTFKSHCLCTGQVNSQNEGHHVTKSYDGIWVRVGVENPGISYSELLFLIPGSRAITSWSFYAIHITKTWTLIYDVTMTSWVQTLIYGTILTPYDTIIRYTISANSLIPSYWLSGLCISLYRTAHTCTNNTGQYIRLALQPVSITNYLVLVPSSSLLWDHSHSISLLLFIVTKTTSFLVSLH